LARWGGKALDLPLVDGPKDLKNRHPDGRFMSTRFHQRANRPEGPFVFTENRSRAFDPTALCLTLQPKGGTPLGLN